MSTKIFFYIFIFFAVILEIIADILFKNWALKNQIWMFVIGLAIYAVGTWFWAYSLKHENLSKAIIIFTIANLVTVIILGVVIFGEKLTPIQIIGILLGILSVVLMEI